MNTGKIYFLLLAISSLFLGISCSKISLVLMKLLQRTVSFLFVLIRTRQIQPLLSMEKHMSSTYTETSLKQGLLQVSEVVFIL